MSQVFISYSHINQNLAKQLAEYLESKGVCVFLDTWRIGIGERISEVLSDALKASRTVILLASVQSLAGNWVRSEIDTALNLEMQGKCRILVVRLGVCQLPALIAGKLYLDVQKTWSPNNLETIYQALCPEIYRNGWSSKPREFAGNGGSVSSALHEEGLPFYRLHLKISHPQGFAGVCWEFIRGGVDVSAYSHFTCKLRAISGTGKRLQLKFETQGPWPIHYIEYPQSSVWIQVPTIELSKLELDDWDVLNRVTVAVDDRDVKIGQEYILDVADFHFTRKITV